MKLLVIAPYQGLRDLFVEVNEELKKDLDIYVGDLYKGVQLVQDLQNEGYDLVISRGATARLLRAHCSLPVVDVPFSAYDILRALHLAKSVPGKLGMMSYLNVIQGADLIGQLLNLDMIAYPINGPEDVTIRLRQAMEDGVETIIGDAVTSSAAQQMGLRNILITSGKESVNQAIRAAEQIAFYTHREKQKVHRFECALNESSTGIYIYDQSEKLIHVNQKGLEILDKAKNFMDFELLQRDYPFLGVENKGSEIEEGVALPIEWDGEFYTITKKKIERDQEEIGRFTLIKSKRNNSDMHPSPVSPRMHFNQLIGSSVVFKKLLETAQNISQSNEPIIIYGERGTGRSSLAEAIHHASPRKEGPFIRFDCSAFSENEVEYELFGYEMSGTKQSLFEKASKGTLFLRKINHLSLYNQERLAEVLKTHRITRLFGESEIEVNVRLIVSANQKLDELILSKRFSDVLYDRLSGFSLYLPPLRERREDLHALYFHFVALFNQKTGRQIVGLSPEVIESLDQFSWPGNINQLKVLIDQLCYSSQSHYVELEDVKELLQNWTDTEEKTEDPSQVIYFSGKTLKQVERELIEKTLEETEFNQSKAAEWLGINRTTLWRKLQQEQS